MIAESAPWKTGLLRDAAILQGFLKPTRTPFRRTAAIERAVFLSSFAMRKLWDARKLSTSWDNRLVRTHIYNLTGDVPTILDRYEIHKWYDLKSRKAHSMRAPHYCNSIIHSFIFIPSTRSHGGLEGFFFASDYERKRTVRYISIKEVIKLLNICGNDYPRAAIYKRQPDGQFVAWLGERLPKLSGGRES